MKTNKLNAHASAQQSEFEKLIPHINEAQKLIEQEAVDQRTAIFNGAMAQVSAIKRKQRQKERLQLLLFISVAIGILMIWGAVVWSGYAQWFFAFWILTAIAALVALPISWLMSWARGGHHV